MSRSELGSANGGITIRVKPEKTEVNPDEVVYVPVTIEGANGVTESNADRKLNVTVTGGELLAFGSANPCTEEQYHTGSFTTYYGRALAVVRAGNTGTVKITANDGKQATEAKIQIR